VKPPFQFTCGGDTLYIQVNYENMQHLYDFTKKFIDAVYSYTRNTLNEYARDDIDWYIGKLESYLDSVYNPELRELKEKSYSLYKAYLSVKDIDKASAAMLYSQYLDKKSKAALLEQKLLSKSNF
jgi:hypothetical protein